MKKVLIIGTGSIAKKHLINLSNLNYKISIFSETQNKIIIKDKFVKFDYVNDLKKLNEYVFVVLANSTNKHIKYLNLLINQKKNIYCEKPISHKAFDYKKLRKKIFKNKIIFFTGYQLLEHEKISFLKKQINKEKVLSFNFQVGHDLNKWREGKYKKNRYFLDKNKGGGVIFELIHEVNLAQQLFGEIKSIKTFKKSSINKKFEDLAVSIIKMKNNIIGSLHQDMISPKYYRNLKILTRKKLYDLDIPNNTLKINNKFYKIDTKKNSHQNLLKKNMLLFIGLIRRKKNTLKYFNQSVSDLNIAIRMHRGY